METVHSRKITVRKRTSPNKPAWEEEYGAGERGAGGGEVGVGEGGVGAGRGEPALGKMELVVREREQSTAKPRAPKAPVTAYPNNNVLA